jgi:hypothetical protein
MNKSEVMSAVSDKVRLDGSNRADLVREIRPCFTGENNLRDANDFVLAAIHEKRIQRAIELLAENNGEVTPVIRILRYEIIPTGGKVDLRVTKKIVDEAKLRYGLGPELEVDVKCAMNMIWQGKGRIAVVRNIAKQYGSPTASDNLRIGMKVYDMAELRLRAIDEL